MLEDIKNSLAENYRDDEDVLSSLIDEATTIALSVSNRKNNIENFIIDNFNNILIYS